MYYKNLLKISIHFFCLASLLGCSTPVLKQPSESKTVQFETSTWLFERTETSSENYAVKIPVSRIIDRKKGEIIKDFSEKFEAYEWVFAKETNRGTIAALDHGVEGRAQEIPIVFYSTHMKKWELIPFVKPHFSAELSQMDIQDSQIRIRLLIDPEFVAKESVTKLIRDSSGTVVGVSDWFYSFNTKKWMQSQTAFDF